MGLLPIFASPGRHQYGNAKCGVLNEKLVTTSLLPPIRGSGRQARLKIRPFNQFSIWTKDVLDTVK